MTTAIQPGGGGGGGGIERPASASLADVIDTILDKGLVIDAYVRVSLVGIELLTIDARIVAASVDTYLKFAEAADRVDLTEHEQPGLPELMQDVTQGGAKHKTKGATQGALEAAGDTLRGFVDEVASSNNRGRASRGSRGEAE
ncbi:MAG TPA: gas vesicle protein GvpJ [Micromonosporaceae bacterium]